MVVYKIQNLKTNKVYIGISIEFNERIKAHKKLLMKNKHYNTHLQNSWNKYGEDNFNISIIEHCDSMEELNEREIYWINLYKSHSSEFGYNKTFGGEGGKKTKETIEKMSLARLKSIENNKNLILRGTEHPRYNKEVSPEVRQKISKKLTGRKLPKDVVEKIRAAVLARPPVSEITREKLRVGKEKPVLCITTNTVYRSLAFAAKELGCVRSNILSVINGKRNHTKGLKFKFYCEEEEL